MSVRAVLVGVLLTLFITLITSQMPVPEGTTRQFAGLKPTIGFIGFIYGLYTLDWLAKLAASALMSKRSTPNGSH